ncbi:hypothetical protein QEZ54_16435 [Catellatospora sp. KI3]|uniref:hypothetical protein n=1 Tax=Catellatospora sp. KI3 TaxID=3041620 RepID=UPI002482B5DC|nr:hypothetical protein [Catellatospora sp. KI3]MDI1462561.1 hypothetical protein [Catellatospora sp. KI3]
MKRGAFTAGLATALLLGGCASSLEDLAEEDARHKAAGIGTAVHGTRNANWTAEQFGRRAAERKDLTLLRVTGKDAVGGVTLTVKVTGTGEQRDGFGGGTTTADYDFCYTIEITLYEAAPPESVDCPAGPPVTYQPLPPPARLPDPDVIAKALTGVSDEAAARAAVAELGLDPRITVETVTRGATVGLALRAVDLDRSSFDCRLARLDTAQGGKPEVWRPDSAQLQPGEMSCSAAEAAGALGQRPPH